MPVLRLFARCLISAMFLLTPWLALGQTVTPLPPALDSALTSLVGLLSDGQALENRDARRLHTVSLYGGLQQDALVLFTLESFGGGADYHHYLAAFEQVQPSGPQTNAVRYRLLGALRVGGIHWREIDFSELRFARGRIELTTREYRRQDPVCCPSRPGRAVYRLRDFNLQEIGGKSAAGAR